MNEKIKECPFCGGKNAKQVGDGRRSWVECGCGAQGPMAGGNDEAAGSVERWNTRKAENYVRREIVPSFAYKIPINPKKPPKCASCGIQLVWGIDGHKYCKNCKDSKRN